VNEEGSNEGTYGGSSTTTTGGGEEEEEERTAAYWQAQCFFPAPSRQLIRKAL